MRTALLADKLSERGHHVLWFASGFEHQRKIWLTDQDQNFQIRPDYSIWVIRGTGYKKNISIARYIDHLRIAWKCKKQFAKFKRPDVIVASMPCYHLAYEAMRYAKRYEVPMIVDIRDLWPDIFIDPFKKYGLHKLAEAALARDFFKLSALLDHADGMVAISQGCLDWGLGKINRSQDKWDRVFYHGYRPNTSWTHKNQTNLNPLNKRKIFLFVGTFGDSYELDLIAEVAKRFDKNPQNDVVFYVIGTGAQDSNLKKKAADLTNMHLPGWLESDKIQTYLNSAWAGIVPCKSVQNAAPNKVFEYLSAGLPLISSLEGELADLIEQYRIGLNYRVGDSEGLYQCVNKLAAHEQLRHRMSKAAQSVFEKFGDADRIYGDYADYIENLVENFAKLA